jgi:hypothetical protein
LFYAVGGVIVSMTPAPQPHPLPNDEPQFIVGKGELVSLSMFTEKRFKNAVKILEENILSRPYTSASSDKVLDDLMQVVSHYFTDGKISVVAYDGIRDIYREIGRHDRELRQQTKERNQ